MKNVKSVLCIMAIDLGRENKRMNVLKKILEEIKKARESIIDMSDEEPELCDVEDWLEEGEKNGRMKAYLEIEKIIRSHMDAGKDTKAPTNDWIPVSERLPEDEQEVWISTKTDCVRRGMYKKQYGFGQREGFLCGDGFMCVNAVNAWIPYFVPEPYKGDCDGKRKI